MTLIDKLTSIFVLIFSVLLALFSLLLPVYAFLPNLIERSVHLGLVLPIIFLARRDTEKGWRFFLNLLITLTGISLCLYIILDFEAILNQFGIVKHPVQTYMGLVMVLIILESARRMIKPVLPAITLLFLLYGLYGHHIPGYFGHVKYDFSQIMGMLYLTTGGIWGQLAGISANIIAIFVFLGALIGATGGGTGFTKIALRVAGRLRGGPGKMAAVSSALFGTISGSASANVVVDGPFTIPLMKRAGFKPPFAAAVEAVASTGGQIMPPIMGAGAFVMAELTQTPYVNIAIAATLPALIYFFTVWMGIHFFAKRDGLRGLEPEEIPPWRETFRASSFFVLPLGVLIFLLLRHYTPQYAAFWAALSALPLAFFTPDWRWDPSFLRKIKEATLEGASQVAMIASICICAQIIIAILSYTGLGVKISTFLIDLSQGALFLTLVLTMLTCIVLGMEVPTTAAYIMAAVVAGPVLIKLGIHPVAAHLFIFYFAILSAITPPVCGAVFIASGIARTDWVETARYSLRLSYAAFLLPFVFIYDHSLLFLQGNLFTTILCLFRTTMAMILLSAGFIGHFRKELNLLGRLIMLGLGILWIVNHWLWDLGGLIGTILILLDRKWIYKNKRGF
ncbi:MAG: TRAP transporter fused permease subunit [Desulfobacterota bacterium]|nr:TRAP transporter fused permease subunit [Thermodesulfobacteriota bacterium]